MNCVVTGGAGFIGSNLTEQLLFQGHSVTVIDNLSLGSRGFLRDCDCFSGFRFVDADLLDLDRVIETFTGHDVVFHMAANSDIPAGIRFTDTDLRQGTLATYNVLEAIRQCGIRQMVFASSSAIYGEVTMMPTPENYGPLFPISLYGASKLASEAMISAFCHNFGVQAWIYRFANICGRHGTHGIIVDLISKLQRNPRQLEVLGDGKQAKPYLHVSECVEGMIFGWKHAKEQLSYYNLGCEGATSVTRISEMLLDALGAKEVELIYTGGQRGWPGDVPQVRLDCARMESLGWRAKLSSDDAVKQATKELVEELACRPLC